MIQQIIAAGPRLCSSPEAPSRRHYHLMDEGKPHRRKLFVLPDQAKHDQAARLKRPRARGRRRRRLGGFEDCRDPRALGHQPSDACGRRRHAAGQHRAACARLARCRLPQGAWPQAASASHSPGADITVIDQNLNWQRSARLHASQIASDRRLRSDHRRHGRRRHVPLPWRGRRRQQPPFHRPWRSTRAGSAHSSRAACPGATRRSRKRGRRTSPGAMSRNMRPPQSGRAAIRCARRRRDAHGRRRRRRDHDSESCRAGGCSIFSTAGLQGPRPPGC